MLSWLSLTEERILTGLAQLTQDRTTILISHRVSTVRSADRIFVLENGVLAEQGTHEDLLQLGGYYADLYQTYFRHQSLEAIDSPAWLDETLDTA